MIDYVFYRAGERWTGDTCDIVLRSNLGGLTTLSESYRWVSPVKVFGEAVNELERHDCNNTLAIL